MSVAYVMGCQALSGIAKDLTKMSAKSAVKVLVPKGDDSGLFKWVALLTGSKNALKGAGFFVGGVPAVGVRLPRRARGDGRAACSSCCLFVLSALPARSARRRKSRRSAGILSNSPGINRLSLARMALFAARDVWFVVSVPIFLASVLGWTFTQIGAFLALWVIGYGGVQSLSPILLARSQRADERRARRWRASLGVRARRRDGTDPDRTSARGASRRRRCSEGLALFGVVFALNSSVHSYLVLAYSEADRVSLSVGFYYMANAAGRLIGTLLSGVLYQGRRR